MSPSPVTALEFACHQVVSPLGSTANRQHLVTLSKCQRLRDSSQFPSTEDILHLTLFLLKIGVCPRSFSASRELSIWDGRAYRTESQPSVTGLALTSPSRFESCFDFSGRGRDERSRSSAMRTTSMSIPLNLHRVRHHCQCMSTTLWT